MHASRYTHRTPIPCPVYPSHTPHIPLTAGRMRMCGMRVACMGYAMGYAGRVRVICRKHARQPMPQHTTTGQYTTNRACLHAHPSHTPNVPRSALTYPSRTPHVMCHTCVVGVRGMCGVCTGYAGHARCLCRQTTITHMKTQENT